MAKTARDACKAPRLRRDATRAAFERKVLLLEEWADSGRPHGIEYPNNHTALRCWRGPDGSFATWADPKIDRIGTGKHTDLADRFESAVQRIANWKGTLEARLYESQAENGRLKAMNASLILQNASLIDKLDGLERRNILLEARDSARSPMSAAIQHPGEQGSSEAAVQNHAGGSRR